MSDFNATPRAFVRPDGDKQIGSDDDLLIVTYYKDDGGVASAPSMAIVCAGDTDRVVTVGGKDLEFPAWTETAFVLEGDLEDVALNKDYEVRFVEGETNAAGSPGQDARALMDDSDALIFRGAQNPSWSSSSAPGSGSLGVTGHRLEITLNGGNTAITRMDWYHTTSERVWKSGAPGSPEAHTRGSGSGSGWYTAGGAFTQLTRGDIEV